MWTDVFNEKPSKEDLALAEREAKGPLPRMATINTSYGEVRLKLFPDECPKTVENFATHAANGYYDGVIFHRVIKGFMIQTGDPLGDGTGGTSIWGHEFEDEFHRALKHDRPFTLSMANAGPGTNGSQFFITTAPCTWLDVHGATAALEPSRHVLRRGGASPADPLLSLARVAPYAHRISTPSSVAWRRVWTWCRGSRR